MRGWARLVGYALFVRIGCPRVFLIRAVRLPPPAGRIPLTPVRVRHADCRRRARLLSRICRDRQRPRRP
jgi:hypothetical protein